MAELRLRKWGNSNAIRLPKAMLQQVGFEDDTLIEVEVIDNKIVLQQAKKKQSIHDLFKGYEGGSFQSELVEFEPLGNEQW